MKRIILLGGLCGILCVQACLVKVFGLDTEQCKQLPDEVQVIIARFVIAAEPEPFETVLSWRLPKTHVAAVNSIQFTGLDGASLISLSNDNMICQWDVGTGQCVRIRQAPYHGTDFLGADPKSSSRFLSADPRYLHVWDSRTPGVEHTYPYSSQGTHVHDAAFFKGQIAVASELGMLQFFNDGYSRPHVAHSLASPLDTLGLSADETALYGFAHDGRVRVFDLTHRKYKRKADIERNLQCSLDKPQAGIVLPSGEYLCINGRCNAIGRYQVLSDNSVAHLGDYTPSVQSRIIALKRSLDGTRIMSQHEDQSVRLWDVHDAARVETINMQDTQRCVACNGDGTMVAAGDAHGVVSLWKLPASRNFSARGYLTIEHALLVLAMRRLQQAGTDLGLVRLLKEDSDGIVALFHSLTHHEQQLLRSAYLQSTRNKHAALALRLGLPLIRDAESSTSQIVRVQSAVHDLSLMSQTERLKAHEALLFRGSH